MKEIRYAIADKRTDRSIPTIIKRAELAIEEIRDVFPGATFEIEEDTLIYVKIQYNPNKMSHTNMFCMGVMFGKLT